MMEKREALGRCLWLLWLASLVTANSAAADVVRMINGDHLTGEVKSLDRGKLGFDTSATGVIQIEWDEVAYVSSEQNIQVELTDGTRHLGHLLAADEPNRIVVETRGGAVDLDAGSVVHLTPIEDRGLSRLDLDLTVGYSFAQANDIEQFQFGVDIDYRTETNVLSVRADAVTSDSSDTEANQRKSLDLNWTRLRPNRWASGAVLRLDSNDALDLDLRTSIGYGIGRTVVQSNSAVLLLAGGIQYSQEDVTTGVAGQDTFEGYAGLTWGWFYYDDPELDVRTNLQIFPSFTNSGRVRAELDIDFTWELISDLFWRLSFYNSYDSDPVVVDAENNDYGVTTSLGWSF